MDSSVTSSHMLSEGFTCLKYVNLNKLDKNLLLKFSKQFSRGETLSAWTHLVNISTELSSLVIYNYKIPTLDLPSSSHPVI